MKFFKKPIFLSQLSKRQIFSLFSFLTILACLPLTIFLVKQQQSYRGKAVGTEAKPINVKITNLHGGGFSVSWTSVSLDDAHQFIDTTGWVEYGTAQNSLNQIAYDDRGGENVSSTTHHVNLFDLNQNTTYYFRIKSGPFLFGLNVAGDGWVRSGTPKQQKTPITLELSGNPHPIYGFIKKGGDTVAGALVYVQLKKDDSETKSALMSTVTNTGEGWVTDAKNARRQGLGSFFDFDNNDRVLIEVQAAEKGTATADFAVSECSPAPEIVLIPSVVSTPTPIIGPTASPTPTLSPTVMPTATPTLMPTATPTPTPLPTSTPTPTATPTPIGTPTPTPTQAPNTANLNFQIKFQGINQQRPDKTAKITLIKEGNLVATYDNVGVSADQNGIYSGRIMNIPTDTYDLYIKGWSHLQKKFANVTLNAGDNSQDWSAESLRAGDVNNDNYVSGADFGILQSAYFEPGPADLNLDGVVNGADFAIMQPNYFECGDSAPGEQNKCE